MLENSKTSFKIGGSVGIIILLLGITIMFGVYQMSKVSNEINAGLVVMLTHGRSGLSKWAFGSVTDKVLRGGNLPVLMVRAPRDIEKT